MLSYPAIFHENEGGGYWVEFPDVSGCFSQGKDLEDAKEMAQEALSLHLASLINHDDSLPKPSFIKGENIYTIFPSRKVLFSLGLRKIRRELGLSQERMAYKLGFSQQHLADLERVGKANPSLSKVDEIERKLGRAILENTP